MFKECLRNGIMPFIVEDDIKDFYYRGLKEWNSGNMEFTYRNTAYNLLSCDFLHSVMDAGFFCAEHLVMICEFGGVCGLYFKSLSLVEYMTVFR